MKKLATEEDNTKNNSGTTKSRSLLTGLEYISNVIEIAVNNQGQLIEHYSEYTSGNTQSSVSSIYRPPRFNS